MTEQTKKEIIKAFAYGATPEEVAEAGAAELETAEQIQKGCAADIEAKRNELKEMGWM